MITPYTHEKHYEPLKKWLAHRGIKIPPRAMFSDFGYCVNDTAIGFLFKTNSRQAFIDNIAANPEKSKPERDLALRALYKELEDEARRCGYLLVTTLSNLETMKSRFENTGYRPFGTVTLFFKSLIGG